MQKKKIVNKLLLARDKFMPEIPLRQSGFTYSFCGSFIQNKKKYKNKKGSKFIYQNKLDKPALI